MTRPVCLFMVNGLGMGNSTRCHAIIKKLSAAMDVHVLTCGNGVNFFQDKKEIKSLNPMEALFYAKKEGGISVARTFMSIGELIRLARKKSEQLNDLLAKLKPSIAITDSEYSIFPLRRRGIPLVGLNNSDVIVMEYMKRSGLPRSIKGQFWFVELNDYLFHRTFMDMVVSPAALAVPPRHPKFKRVGLVVRDEILEASRGVETRPFPAPREIKRVALMLSGSVFASKIGAGLETLPYKIDVIGREGKSHDNVTYHGKLTNNVELLKSADMLVINGGFSAVSEAISLNKPTFIIPVPGHAEQYINGLLIQDLGVGYIVEETEVVPRLKRFHDINSWEGLPPSRRGEVDTAGAETAALEIIKFHAEIAGKT